VWQEVQSLTRPKASGPWEARKFMGWNPGEPGASWHSTQLFSEWHDVQFMRPVETVAE
jgi:hypothetical protein